MWITDCGLTSIGDLYGELHFPTLEQGERINVMRSFGDISAECGCLASTGGEFPDPCVPSRLDSPTNPGESTPRAQRVATDEPANGAAPVARISIFTPEGLRGQVVINSQNTGLSWSELCKGIVTIGDEESPQAPDIVLSKALAQPNQLPYYQRTSAELGGGAVGVAPFHMHDEACDPPNGQIGTNQGVAAGWFYLENTPGVTVEHYGPINLNTEVAATWNDAIIIEGKNTGICGFYGGVDNLFTVKGPGSAGWTSRRSFGLFKHPNTQPKSGVFRVRLVPGAIVCDDVTDEPEVVWDTLDCDDEPAYVFQILPDCDLDREADHVDMNDNCATNACLADYDDSGVLSVQDIFDFLGAYFGGAPCADFNGSDSISVQDIFDFLGAWFSAPNGLCIPSAYPECPNCRPEPATNNPNCPPL